MQAILKSNHFTKKSFVSKNNEDLCFNISVKWQQLHIFLYWIESSNPSFGTVNVTSSLDSYYILSHGLRFTYL